MITVGGKEQMKNKLWHPPTEEFDPNRHHEGIFILHQGVFSHGYRHQLWPILDRSEGWCYEGDLAAAAKEALSQ